MDNLLPFTRPRPDEPTAREHEILNHIWGGLTSQEIALRLSIAPKTVESHRANLLRKFRASNSAQLLRFALLDGMLTISSPKGGTSPGVARPLPTSKETRKLTGFR